MFKPMLIDCNNNHLPLKKRFVKDISTFDQFHPKEYYSSTLSSASSTTSETSSVDSGFSDIEPLDLSFHSTSFSASPSHQSDTLKSPSSDFTKPPLVCSKCSKVYESSSRYRAHIRRHESKQSGRYRCTVCEKNFVQRSSLRTHERIHTGEKPYHCSMCNERFGDFSTYTKHRRTHTGEKPYSCPICCRCFSQSGNMHRHLKVVHKPHLNLYHPWSDSLQT